MEPAQLSMTITRCAHYVAELYGKGCPVEAYQHALAHELMKNLLQVEQNRVSGLVINESVIVTINAMTPTIWSTEQCETLMRVNNIPNGLHINLRPAGVEVTEVKIENGQAELFSAETA